MSSETNQPANPSESPRPSISEYDFSKQVGHLLRKVYQRHLAIFQQHSCDRQLTAVQFAVLCALRDNGPNSQSELGRITAIDHATIRGIFERLKARGLIELSATEQDRRKVIASLTQDGRATLDAMVPHALQITELTMGDLNPAERVAMLFLLQKIIATDEV